MRTLRHQKVHGVCLAERPGIRFPTPGAVKRTHGAVVRGRRFAVGAEPNQPSGGGAAMIKYPFDSDSSQVSESQWLDTHVAIDIADAITMQSLDAAQNAISFGDRDRALVLQLAGANIQAAAIVYAAQMITTALREMTPEVACAVSKACTDIAAGVLG
jgi:hypothetical protein